MSVDTQTSGLVDAHGRPVGARVAPFDGPLADASCPTPECRGNVKKAPHTFGSTHEICSKCGYDFGEAQS